jgi:nicotinamidase/pyrazinamidase
MKTALMVVDMQNDFCPGGTLPVPNGNGIVPIVNMLLSWFPLSVLTQDWHPHAHVSFASTFSLPPFSLKVPSDPRTILWPDHCVAGTWGADFVPGLETWRARLIVRKGANIDLDSYSAFYENDGVTPTGLSGWLAAMGIERVLIAGLATEYCVKASALDARKCGFEVTIISDAVGGIEAISGDIEKAFKAMRGAGCEILPSSGFYS